MLPAAWPAIRLYRGLGTGGQVALFTAGYLAVWVAAAGLAMLVMAPPGPLLAVAGVYQLGPLQAVALRRCRSPLGLLVRRSGLRAGIEYAIACAGCCAGLMLALVALDLMMSIVWMTGLVVLVLAEKLLRHGVLVGRVAGVGIVGLAIVTLL
jgi:predicted metal-binding membrane protein